MTSNYPYYGAPYGEPQYYPEYAPPPPPYAPPPRRTGRRALLVTGWAAVTAAAVVAGIAIGHAGNSTVAGAGSGGTALSPGTYPGNVGSLPGLGGYPGSRRDIGGGSVGSGGNGSTTTSATDTQASGVVTVASVLKYQGAESEGTGMVLTSDGEILTNNHVIDGATSTTVTVVSTGKSYPAVVVGTDPSDDVAVLQLRGASGLQTAKIGDSSTVAKGDSIVGVGNAGGTGSLTASGGTVTGLGKSITATDDNGANGEKLSGLIQIDAGIISGDSGGPLYNSSGQVVGMDTAASQNPAQTIAYAIPINHAVSIAGQIETGVETTSIHIGYPGFLGVAPVDGQGGVGIGTVLPGTPAARAGMTQGSVITKVNGKSVSSATALHNLLSSYEPGARVTVTWVGLDGATHTATVTLTTGPAD